MLVKSVLRKGGKNTRVSLVDGNTALVPTSIADSLVGKELPAEYAVASGPVSSKQPKAEKPAAVAVPTPDIPPADLANFSDI